MLPRSGFKTVREASLSDWLSRGVVLVIGTGGIGEASQFCGSDSDLPASLVCWLAHSNSNRIKIINVQEISEAELRAPPQ